MVVVLHGGLRKQLAQVRPSGTSAVSAYTPGSTKTAKVTLVAVANTTNSGKAYSLYHDDDGNTFNEGTALVFERTIGANEREWITLDNESAIYMNNGAGHIGVKSSASDALTFTFYGIEEYVGITRSTS